MTIVEPSAKRPELPPWEPGPEGIEWKKIEPPLGKARVHAEWRPTRDVLYELCSAGGLRFIRRTRHSPYRVDQSPGMIAGRVDTLWQMLLNGQIN